MKLNQPIILMRKLVFALLFFLSFAANGQKPKCDSLFANFDSARIELVVDSNRIFITADMTADSISKMLKCFEATIESNDEKICGSQINFIKENFAVNTDAHYLEIRPDFKGKATIDVINSGEEEMYNKAGDPERVTDVRIGDDQTFSAYLYPKYYGTLAIWVDMNLHKVVRICFYKKKPADIDLCVNY